MMHKILRRVKLQVLVVLKEVKHYKKNSNILTDVEQWTFSSKTLTLPNVG